MVVTGLVDEDGNDELVELRHTLSHTDDWKYNVLNFDDLGVTVQDDDKAAVVLNATNLNVQEGESTTYTVSLATEPSSTVTVTVTSADSDAVSVEPNSLVFESSGDNVWTSPQTVTVTGLSDPDTLDEQVQIAHSISTSAGSEYAGLTVDDVSVSVVDDDTSGLILSSNQVTVTEGSTAQYTVELASQPTASVTVTLSSTDSDKVTVTPSTLTFEPLGNDAWNVQQTVSIQAKADDDASNETVTLQHTLTSTDSRYRGLPARTVSVTVNDDDTAAVVLSSSELVIAEDTSSTYSVHLSTRPNSPVTVRVSSSKSKIVSVDPNSLTFQPNGDALWSSPQSIRVTATSDDDGLDEDVELTHSVASTDSHYNEQPTPSVSLSVVDNDEAAIVLSETSLNVDEGKTATYTIKLATNPNRKVTVTPTSSDESLFLVSSPLNFGRNNWRDPKTVTVTVLEDDDFDHEVGQISHTVKRYKGVVTPPSLDVQIKDNDVPEFILSSSNLTLDEGTQARYEIQLDPAPNGTVTVAVSSSDSAAIKVSPETIEFSSSKVKQQVVLTGVEDDDANNESVEVRHSITSSNDPLYRTDLALGSVRAEVNDNDEASVVVSSSNLNIDEGDSATYSVKLATAPSASVTVSITSDDTEAVSIQPSSLTFTPNGDQLWSTAQEITVRAHEDDDDADENVALSYTLTSTDSNYGALSVDSGTVDVLDNDTAAVNLSDTLVKVFEGSSTTYSVRLATKPSQTVVVTPATNDSTIATVSGALSFEPQSWDKPQKVTVTAVTDAGLVDTSAEITHSVSGYGSVTSAAGLTVNVKNVTPPQVNFEQNALYVDENGTQTYKVWLSSRPSARLTVIPRSSDEDHLTVSGAVRFTPNAWRRQKTITVTALEDADAEDETLEVRHTVRLNGRTTPIGNVAVTTYDDEKYAVVVNTTTLSVDEGDTASYYVSLSSQPTSLITITPISSNTNAATVSGSMNFTPEDWQLVQQVVVSAVRDSDYDDERVVITHRVTGGDSALQAKPIRVRIVDEAQPEVLVSPATVDVGEGNTATYEVWLATQPSKRVTVTPKSSDKRAVAVSGPLKFNRNSWNKRKTVTVTAKQDKNSDNEQVHINHEVKNYGDTVLSPLVLVNVTDDEEPIVFRGGSADSPNLVISPYRVTVTEAAGDSRTATYTVKLATQPSAAVSVSLTSRDETVATVSPETLNFTTTNWMNGQTVTVTGVDDTLHNWGLPRVVNIDHTASGGDYGTVTGRVRVSVSDDETTTPTFSVADASVSEGDTGTVDLSFKVTLDPPSERVAIVILETTDDSAIAGSDYVSYRKWVRFNPGETEKTVTVEVYGDGVDESDESLTVTLNYPRSRLGTFYLEGPELGDAVAIGTIIDDDEGASSFSIADASVSEGDSGMVDLTFNVTLDPAAGVVSSVDWSTSKESLDTATPGTDYSAASGTLSFAVGDTSKTVTVKITGDESDEGDETLTVRLSGQTSGFGLARPNAIGTIRDDDRAGFVFTPPSVTVTEASGATQTSTYTVALASRPLASPMRVVIRLRRPIYCHCKPSKS